ncbi:class I adenylate-forming enzyme family protein [Marivivens donghaensis]|jgi:acyl-coenzyme A synthetase/AMP-(fatty) acid ligase|uniref:class I adenylate-forming enzyme family protein n=1 Tax=Marivivens donghaensis TaxID=1699413 RepID=UPI003F6A0D78
MISEIDTSPFTACPEPFNMADHVLQAGRATPDKVALSVISENSSEDWTFADLETAIRGVAAGLLAQGLTAGDRVLMRLGNTPEFPICYLASIAVGLIPVPTSSQLTATEIRKIAKEIDPALIVADDGIALPDHSAPVLMASELEAFHSLAPAPFDFGSSDRPAYIIYTSGTSGKPRAVVHAHRAVWARQMMWTGWYDLRPTDRLMHAGAFNWTYTLGTGLMDPWAAGATALIPANGTKPTDLPALITAHKATLIAAAPGVYRQMLRSDIPSMPSLRHGFSAGEKLPESLRDAWTTVTGTKLYEAYGMSECSTFLSSSPSRPAPTGTLGFPQNGRRIALIDENGPVPIGSAGTIGVHKSDLGLMIGYLDQPEETAARFVGDWFLTGDVGRMSEDGAITYEGRADDMMNAGGYRVSPVEVEEALATHPDIHEVAASEVTVKADTTVIAAFYTSAEKIDTDTLAAFAASRIARYKCPRIFVRVPVLPRGANNKLLRRNLRADWEATHGQA